MQRIVPIVDLPRLVAWECTWFATRSALAGRRWASHATGLRIIVKNASRQPDSFCTIGIAVEVTHRSQRRLFGLTGLAPLGDEVAPPHRPEPGRGQGRLRLLPTEAADTAGSPPALPPLSPLAWRAFDYGDLAEAITQLDHAIRYALRSLEMIVYGERSPAHQTLERGSASADHTSWSGAGAPEQNGGRGPIT